MNREKIFDNLRGVTVLLMILAHVIAFFYVGDNYVLSYFRTLGDTVAFSTFLFVSGAVSYIAYLSKEDNTWKTQQMKLLKRVGTLLLGYYFVAIVSSLENIKGADFLQVLSHVGNIIIFVEVPDYTEFILSFILYGLILIIFRKQIKFIISKPLILFIFVWVAYILGFILYYSPCPEFIMPLKSLFVGNLGFYRFPILQYMPIYFLGFYIGKYFEEYKTKTDRGIQSIVFLGAMLACLVTLKLSLLESFPYGEDYGRWPPTIAFLLIGQVFVFASLLVLNYIDLPKQVDRVIGYLGKNALSMYMIHIIILELIDLFFGFNTNSIIITVFSYIIIIIFCVFFILFFKKKWYNNYRV